MDNHRSVGIPTKEEAMASATAQKLPAFAVDKQGLAKLLARKGKGFAVTELIQNAWDENTTQVDVTLERIDGDLWRLVVQDDNPEGFKDLRHAYTLFAESEKKGDATKRGRFNLGEKLVIAVCEQASIATTKGTIVFAGDHRLELKDRRKGGSVFTGDLRMADDEAKEIESLVHTLLPPENITTTYNLSEVPARAPLRIFEASLRTEIADNEGRLKPTTRKTKVEIYEPQHGEVATIYELGIPIVETGDRFHVNVLQKVPLPTDRDNVSPGYLRDVRTAVLNNCFDLLGAGEKEDWIVDAMQHKNVGGDALTSAFAGMFGNAVTYDPTDPEANKRATAEGYTVVTGGALPKAAWSNLREAGVVKPAGQVTPSPTALINKQGDGFKRMEPAHWTTDIKNVVAFAKDYAMQIIGAEIDVEIGNDPKYPANATYGRVDDLHGKLMLNVGKLGHKWFASVGEHTFDLLFDEFGHHFATDHLDERYYRALRMLGARSTMLALTAPDFFEAHGIDVTKLSAVA